VIYFFYTFFMRFFQVDPKVPRLTCLLPFTPSPRR
jgi:hypothetical protein